MYSAVAGTSFQSGVSQRSTTAWAAALNVSAIRPPVVLAGAKALEWVSCPGCSKPPPAVLADKRSADTKAFFNLRACLIAAQNLLYRFLADPAQLPPVLGDLCCSDCLACRCPHIWLGKSFHVLGLGVAARVLGGDASILFADNPVVHPPIWNLLAHQLPQQTPDTGHLSFVEDVRCVVRSVVLPDEAVSKFIGAGKKAFCCVDCFWHWHKEKARYCGPLGGVGCLRWIGINPLQGLAAPWPVRRFRLADHMARLFR